MLITIAGQYWCYVLCVHIATVRVRTAQARMRTLLGLRTLPDKRCHGQLPNPRSTMQITAVRLTWIDQQSHSSSSGRYSTSYLHR
jgi:hypothetical protein